MIIDGNIIKAEKDKTLWRRYDNGFVGIEYSLGYVYYKNGEKLDDPYLETPEDFKDVDLDEATSILRYGNCVDGYIREKYSLSEELAIQRQRDTKPEAFQEYFDFCEECKKRAWRDLGIDSIEFAE